MGESILAENCGHCHGPALTRGQAQAGVNYITDFDLLVANGFVSECAAESSRLIQMMRNDHDGKFTELPEVPPRDIDRVADYIDWGCTATQTLCAEQPALSGCAMVEAERVLDQRCGMCHGEAQRERQRQTGVQGFSFLEIDDMSTLLARGLVIPCDSEGSPLVRRMRDGSMPPADSFQPSLRMTDEQRVTTFIDGLCTPPVTPELIDERLRLEELLRASCGDCHGQVAVDSGSVQASALLENIELLQRQSWLIPCNSAGSPLVQRMRTGDMPPFDSDAPRLTSNDIEALAQFVDRPCVAP